MEPRDRFPNRRDLVTAALTGAACALSPSPESRAQEMTPREVFLERDAQGTPHKGKVLLAVQAHSDDIPLMAAGTVAKLVREGYTGYLLRATNDDMGDAVGLGTPGTVGDHVLGNERDNAEVARVLGLKKVFDLNYSNHRMGDVSQNELQCRLIFLIRLLKVDTVVCWDPWAHDEENPDHTQIARGIEAACWMAGRAHDYPEQLAAGLTPHAVEEKYYYARRPEITAPDSGPSWPRRVNASPSSATTIPPPTATTLGSSSSSVAVSWARNTASGMPRRSTISAARAALPLKNTS